MRCGRASLGVPTHVHQPPRFAAWTGELARATARRSHVCLPFLFPRSNFPAPSSFHHSAYHAVYSVPCAESTTWRPALELRTWARWRRTTHVLTRATARSLSPVSTVALCVLPDCGLAGSLGCVALPKEAAGPLGRDMRAAASDGGATRGGRADASLRIPTVMVPMSLMKSQEAR